MIGIDMTFVGNHEIENGYFSEGVSINCEQILHGIQESNESGRFVLLVFRNQEKFIRNRFPNYSIRVIDSKIARVLLKIFRKDYLLPALLRKYVYSNKINDLDCIWFPFAVSGTFVRTRIKTICTIHDLIMYRNGNEKIKKKYQQGVITNPDVIVTISSAVKNEILEEFNYHKEIVVIPNAINHNAGVEETVPELKYDKYILDVNAFTERKNTLTLLEAYNSIKDLIPEKLVLCGGYKEDIYYNKLIDYISNHNLEKDVFVFLGIEENKKNYLFEHAELFVMPSFAEGFGRTPIEAALSKIPVICSDIPVLREVTLGLVKYYSPIDDSKKLAEAIMQVINEEKRAEDLDKISQEFASHYSVKACVNKYLSVFDQL